MRRKTLLVLVGVAAIGCGGSAPSVIGTWYGAVAQGAYVGSPATLTVGTDRTYPGDYNSDGIVDVRATYAVSGNRGGYGR
ncbi:MAG TPA: hypothetical protein VGM51_01790 [Armatimonadota bacterium]|jgi:hypothetical protein